MGGQAIRRYECRIVEWKYVTVEVGKLYFRNGRCDVCGEAILRCKCRVVNWKYVRVVDEWL